MIELLGDNLWYAPPGEEIPGEVHLIRDDTETKHRLFHICDRTKQDDPPGEIYITGKVNWDLMLGQYYCMACREELEADVVWADGLGAGCEYEC
jgi:hypothetical protein